MLVLRSVLFSIFRPITPFYAFHPIDPTGVTHHWSTVSSDQLFYASPRNDFPQPFRVLLSLKPARPYSTEKVCVLNNSILGLSAQISIRNSNPSPKWPFIPSMEPVSSPSYQWFQVTLEELHFEISTSASPRGGVTIHASTWSNASIHRCLTLEKKEQAVKWKKTWEALHWNAWCVANNIYCIPISREFQRTYFNSVTFRIRI